VEERRLAWRGWRSSGMCGGAARGGGQPWRRRQSSGRRPARARDPAALRGVEAGAGRRNGDTHRGGEEECQHAWRRKEGRTGGVEGGSRSGEAHRWAARGAARSARGAPIVGRRRHVEAGAGGD
jgi:hypothetical protein